MSRVFVVPDKGLRGRIVVSSVTDIPDDELDEVLDQVSHLRDSDVLRESFSSGALAPMLTVGPADVYYLGWFCDKLFEEMAGITGDGPVELLPGGALTFRMI